MSRAAVAAPMRISAGEFLSWPEDGNRYELIDGEVYAAPAPTELRQRVVANLLYELTAHLRRTGSGRAYTGPLDVELDDKNVYQPDVLVLLAGGAANVDRQWVKGPPDLAVEVVSPSSERRDRVVKLAVYARAGVREVWLVSQRQKTVDVARPAGPGRLDIVAHLSGARLLTTPLLPGFRLAVRKLFA